MARPLLTFMTMPRTARVDYPGALQHVMFRGVAGFTIFRDDLDRRVFLSQARETFDAEALRCLIWSLMTNHSHLGSQTLDGSLSNGMHRLETRYAMYFNKRNRRQGHVMQDRYKSLLVDEEIYLLRVVRYVMLNPIEGGLVRSLDELEKYPWTSYPALLGHCPPALGDPEFTLKLFADGEDSARRELRSWMAEGLRKKDPIGAILEAPPGRPSKKLEAEMRAAMIGDRDSAVVGNDRFISEALSLAKDPRASFHKMGYEGWTVDSLIERICAEGNISRQQLKQGRRTAHVSRGRAAAAWIGRNKLGLKLSDIAVEVGVSPQALSQSLVKGEVAACESFSGLLSELADAACSEEQSTSFTRPHSSRPDATFAHA